MNEVRLIDANAYRKQLCESVHTYNPEEPGEYVEAIDFCIDLLDVAPTVPAEVVRHGRWVKPTTVCKTWQRCSECNEATGIYDYNYYPVCGCKMDLDAKEEENG